MFNNSYLKIHVNIIIIKEIFYKRVIFYVLVNEFIYNIANLYIKYGHIVHVNIKKSDSRDDNRRIQ